MDGKSRTSAAPVSSIVEELRDDTGYNYSREEKWINRRSLEAIEWFRRGWKRRFARQER